MEKWFGRALLGIVLGTFALLLFHGCGPGRHEITLVNGAAESTSRCIIRAGGRTFAWSCISSPGQTIATVFYAAIADGTYDMDITTTTGIQRKGCGYPDSGTNQVVFVLYPSKIDCSYPPRRISAAHDAAGYAWQYLIYQSRRVLVPGPTDVVEIKK